jgi:hypothetical protein
VSDDQMKVTPGPDTETTAESEPEKVEYLEFVGSEPYGTEFYGQTGTHSITDKHMKEYHDVPLGKKEVVWSRGKNGRFLVPTADLNPDAVTVLADDPMFKVVTV